MWSILFSILIFLQRPVNKLRVFVYLLLMNEKLYSYLPTHNSWTKEAMREETVDDETRAGTTSRSPLQVGSQS